MGAHSPSFGRLMAEESINLSFTQEICESNSSAKTSKKKLSFPDNGSCGLPENHRTSSDSSHDARDPRRNSTGKPSAETGHRKIVPHYLRASTGSCHDFCKYGRKQALEEKEIRPWRRRIVKSQTDKHNPAETVSLGERKKAMLLKQTTLPDRKSISFKQKSSPAAIKSDHVRVIIKKEVLLPSKKGEASSKIPSSLDKKSKVENRVSKLSSIHSLSVPPPVVKQLSPSHTLNSAEKTEKGEASSKIPSSLDKKSKVENRVNKLSSIHSLFVPPRVVKQLSPSHTLNSAEKTEKAERTMKSFSQKSFPTVRPHLGKPKSTSSSHTPVNINGRGKIRDDVTASKNMVAAKASAKKVLAPPTASSLSITRNISLKGKKSKSLKQESPSIDQNSMKRAEMGELENQNVPEKTLHVIMTETENNMSESTADSEVIPSLASPLFPTPESLSQCQCPPFSSQDEGDKEELEGESEQNDSVDEEEEVEEDENGHASEEVNDILSDKDGMTNDIKAVEGNRKKTLRKGSVFPGSKDPTPVKLMFRRGKVVDLQSERNGRNGPRRLRFRGGRVTDESQDRKVDIRRRTFKKKGSHGDGNVSNPSKDKVVLRHQDMQEKKDAQGLFNNVIEETASKLVESRKSKVKALVGAFETLISQQDTKPSS